MIRFYFIFFVGICSTATTQQQPSVEDKIWIWRHSHIHRYAIYCRYTPAPAIRANVVVEKWQIVAFRTFVFFSFLFPFLGIGIGISKCERSTRFLCSNRIIHPIIHSLIYLFKWKCGCRNLPTRFHMEYTVCDCRVTRPVHGRHVRSCACVNRLSVKTLFNFRFINYI